MSAVVFLPVASGKVTIIDFEDFNSVRDWKWGLGGYKRRYVCRKLPRVSGKPRGTEYLHRRLFAPGQDLTVDHRDGDPLNNRRENFRPKTNQGQAQAFQRKPENTSSKFRGVCWLPKFQRWLAYIKADGRGRHIGRFTDEIEAAKARDDAARRAGFEKEALNFP